MLNKIRRKLEEKNLEALLLTSIVNRRYATGFPSSDGMALITHENAYFLTDSRYIEAAQKTVSGFSDIILISSAAEYETKVNELINKKNMAKIGIEEESLSYVRYKKLSEKLEAKLEPAQDVLNELRMVKNSSEIDKLKKAQELAERAFDRVLGEIKPGMTEKELAAEIVYSLLKFGADGVSFDPIVVSGSNTSMPHGMPSDDKIMPGTFVTMDFGCRLDGYCSDMTRTVAVGNASREMREVYDAVLRAQIEGIYKARAGIAGSDVDDAAREVIKKAGFGDYFGHGFGHGIGLEVHEGPRAAPSYKGELPEGSVISAEPGIYLPGKFGVRIEDVIVITKDGTDNLMKAAKELIII